MNSFCTPLLTKFTPLLFIALYCLQANCVLNAVMSEMTDTETAKLLEGDLFLYQSS